MRTGALVALELPARPDVSCFPGNRSQQLLTGCCCLLHGREATDEELLRAHEGDYIAKVA